MRKLGIVLLTTWSLCTVSIPSLNSALFNTAYAQQKPIPPYAKWGVYALKKTHERYPKAQIHDYLHIGRTVGPHTSTEKFKLWLKENNKEFGVYINIEFNNKTEKVINVTFRESTR